MTVNQRGEVERSRLVAELQAHLDTVDKTERGRMLSVRGRRQVGKSTLLEQFVDSAGVPSMFATGRKGASAASQVADAEEALRVAPVSMPGMDLLLSPPSRNWEDLLRRLAAPAAQGPIILIMDEFPWMIESDRALESTVQAIWDRVLERLPVLLILVGSDVAMMERLSEHDRPLFGRARQMAVAPFSPAEIAVAVPSLEPAEVIEAALVTGGFPRLVRDLAAQESTSVEEFVRDSLADPYSALVATAQLTLAAEFPAQQEAQAILSEIGANDIGRTTFSDLVSERDAAGGRRAETAATRALRQLVEVKGLVERETPAWAKPNGRKRRYRVSDAYLRFWYRYVDPRLAQIMRGRGDLAIARFERDWPSWRGYTVEPLVRDALTRLGAFDERLSGVEMVDRWWRDAYQVRGVAHPDVEVDLVGRSTSTTDFVGSIKWRHGGRIAPQEVAELRRHRELVPRAEGARLAVVTPSGQRVPGVDLTFGAEDLIAAYR